LLKNRDSSPLTVLSVAVGVFITSLDINVANIALPVIQRKFGVSVSEVQWIVVGYLFVLCAAQLMMGRLADLIGPKKVYLWGVAGFSAASLLCGLSFNLALLVGSRILQAIFGAMIVATSNALITAAVPAGRRGTSLSATSVAVALSTMAGPPLGGFLVQLFGWNSVFLINVPIGILAGILGSMAIRADSRPRSEGFDSPGAALFLGALSSWLFLLEALASGALDPLAGLAAALVGIVLSALFIAREARAASPLVDPKLFRNRAFLLANVSATLFFVAEFLLIFIVPYYLQGVRGLSASSSGLAMLPMSIGMVVAAPFAGMLSDRVQPRLVAAGGLMALAGTSLVLSTFQAATPSWIVMIDFLLAGAGAGLFQAPNANAVMSNVEPSRRGVAGAALGTMRNLGMLLGEAGAAAMLASAAKAPPDAAAPGILKALAGIGIAAAAIAAVALALSLSAPRRGRVAGPDTST
jgi:EmrB/QacA subfamily drug resistance transporter